MDMYECVRESDGSFQVEKLGKQSEGFNGNSEPYIPLEVTPEEISQVSQPNQPNQVNQANPIEVPKKLVEISNKDQLKSHNLTGAKVLSCVIEGTPIEKTTWSNSIKTLYKQIADGVIIIKDSILEIKTVKKVDEGFTFIKNLGISVRVKELRKNLVKEIFTQAKANNLSVHMEIELANGTVLVVNIPKAN